MSLQQIADDVVQMQQIPLMLVSGLASLCQTEQVAESLEAAWKVAQEVLLQREA